MNQWSNDQFMMGQGQAPLPMPPMMTGMDSFDMNSGSGIGPGPGMGGAPAMGLGTGMGGGLGMGLGPGPLLPTPGDNSGSNQRGGSRKWNQNKDNINAVDMDLDNDGNNSFGRDKRGGSYKGGSDKRRRSRSRDRSSSNRSDRRDRDRRPSKWSNNDNEDPQGMGNQSMGPQGIGPQGMGPQVMGNMGMGNMGMGNNDMMQGGNNMMPYGNNQGNYGNNGNMYNNMMMGMMPNMMMDQSLMGYPMNPMMPSIGPFIAGQPIYVTNATLLPPQPGTNIPTRRERPPGCRTIFIGGLPTSIREDTLREIFLRFGNILDVKINRKGFSHLRFEEPASVDSAFCITGYRFKYHDMMDCDATKIFIDYALNREDQADYERSQRPRSPSPPRAEPCSPAALSAISDKIKSEDQFAAAAPTLAVWLERGECNKKNVNTFYSLIQASNNQTRRLFTEKMALDEEFQTLKATMKEKYGHIITQFEQVAKILSAAKIQRAWDHFSKQQRRNIEMWQKMTEDLQNMKEEFASIFDEEDSDKPGKKVISEESLEALKRENEKLSYELEGYRNDAHMANEAAERKFEKFKAHFIAQQALQGNTFQPLQPPPVPPMIDQQPPKSDDDDKVNLTAQSIPPTEARLISMVTAFLMVHPLGASVDYLVSYIRSLLPSVTQATVLQVLQSFPEVFARRTSGVGASIDTKWCFVTFNNIKTEN